MKIVYSLVKMSDNFLKIARQEIQEELDSLKQILLQCNDDNDISNNGNKIEKHLHKIKGLAPMMGQNNVGEIAKLNDIILRHIIENGMLSGTHQIINESIHMMQEIFNDTNKKDIDEFKTKICNIFSHIFNQ
ncbi:MAG: Hpt domain-containing protein [Thaumarchaeota archaeon]|nr:Hpt domain-containing protein [Nitrososphaerota archaeon]MBI3641171.1 Hpt domain-containing protein [Nitrososphaerota archaeon]